MYINLQAMVNKYLSLYKNLGFNEKWINLIDRNRSVENKDIFSKDKWVEIFNKHNFCSYFFIIL